MDHEKYYDINRLYYALVNNQDVLVYEDNNLYIELFLLDDLIYKGSIVSCTILKPLIEEIKEKNIDICLYYQNGTYKNVLSLKEIISINDVILKLNKNSFNNLDYISYLIVNYITDLLGINVISNKNSNLELKVNSEISVFATKQKKFKDILFNYIKTSLLFNDDLEIKHDDYRIKKALLKSKINFHDDDFILYLENGVIDIESPKLIKKESNKRYEKVIKSAWQS